ncbi:MAG: 50S ribosomal protein L11 methyltransferase [Bryobacteraceae bacterium]
MHCLWLECGSGEKELLLAGLYGHSTLGVTEHDLPGGRVKLQAFFDGPLDLDDWSTYAPRWETVQFDARWQPPEPLLVGERWFLVPEGRDDATPAGRLRLPVHLGMASGSGYHAPTQLALEALEQTLLATDDFLDVGAGTGILCHAAALLGCCRRVGCDIDSDAVAVARRTGVPAEMFVGSPRSLRAKSFDAIAANLNAETLLGLRHELLRVLRPGGRLILSGFQHHRADAVTVAFELPVRQMFAQDRWRCAVLSA